jgi:toxin ParE1/3/4
MNRYRLTERADRDIFDIFLCGMQHFGLAQAQQYRDSLTGCFDMLAENPRMGRAADAIATGIWRHEHGSHVILYEERPGDVLILALVHVRSVRRLRDALR